MPDSPAALEALAVPPRKSKSSYPAEFASRVDGRVKRPLGDAFGLSSFGVNLTLLPPGSISALRHSHGSQDEFVYILDGNPTLVTNSGRTILRPGMCAGFPHGTGDAHHLVNETGTEVRYLEIGDRTSPDDVVYPDDDLSVVKNAAGVRIFAHKDGTPY